MMQLIYLIGVPGSGKSTVMEEALFRLNTPSQEFKEPIAHVRFDDVWYLGVRRQPFGGTDAMSMSVNPKAIEFLPQAAEAGCRALIGEGDRLANAKFLSAWPSTTIVYLDTPYLLARERAAVRAVSLGRPEQSPSWWKGRVTKVDNLLARFPHTRLDGAMQPDVLGALLYRIIRKAADRAPAG